MDWNKLSYSIGVFILSSLFLSTAWSCTGIQLKSNDGAIINGRTVEFGIPLGLSAVIIPRNYEFKGTLPDGTTGIVYKTKYAAIGGGTFGSPDIADGINEKGLAIGDFYFPGYAGYATITPENKSRALSPTEFSNWILTQFATIDEVKAGLKSIVIAPTTPKGWPNLPPFHYVVYDNTGKSIAIEPINGELKVYDNPIGVFTNSPTFDWHLTNLSNYLNLTPVNAPAPVIDGFQLTPFGQGSGLHGMPGDFTPPSRFVRAAIFSYNAVPADTGEQTVLQAFHILNQFDIPLGAVRSEDNGKTSYDYTSATTVRDLKNLKYYFKTYEDQSIKMIALSAFDLNAKTIKFIPMVGTTPITNVSKSAK